MALNIKNPAVEQLAAEVARMADESKTEAIRQALIERKRRLLVRRGSADRRTRLEQLLKTRIWPGIPKQVLGKRLTKRQEEMILGYGPEGF